MERKKVFKITINGVSEAVDTVKSLNAQLKELEASISRIGERKIKVSAEVETPKATKSVVTGNNSASSDSQLVEKERELAIQKQINAELKATAQAQAAVTQEYKEALAEQMRQQEVVRGVKQEMKDMFSGAKTEAGEYTNTLAGLRAELRDLSAQQKSVELGSEEYNRLDDRILSITSNLKALESAHGDFRRNVGNYPTAEVEAFRKQFESLYSEMQRLVQESNDLQRQLSQQSPGTEQYNLLAVKLKDVQSQLDKAKENVDSFNASLRGVPKTFEIKVGNTVRNFSSMREAVRTLTQELQQMTLEGRNNTTEFSDTIEALGRVKTAMKSASDEASSFIGNAKTMSDTLEIMNGVAGLAGIGQGLMMLFGGTNKELDESIQKFGGLMIVMQGIDAQWRAMKDTNSIYGDSLMKVWNWLDKIGDWKFMGLPSLNEAIAKTEQWGDTLKMAGDFDNGKFAEKFHNIFSQMKDMTNGLTGEFGTLRKEFLQITDQMGNFEMAFRNVDVSTKLKIINEDLEATRKYIELLNSKKLKIETGEAEGNIDEINNAISILEQHINNVENVKLAVETGDTGQLFKDLNSDLDAFGAKIDELDAKGIDTKQIRGLYEELKKTANAADLTGKNIGKIPGFLKAMGSAGVVASKAISMLSTVIKGLMKSTVILGVVQIAFELITAAVEGLGKLIGYVWGNIKSVFGVVGAAAGQTEAAVDSLNTVLDMTNDRIKRYNDEVSRLKNNGVVSEVEALELGMKNLENEISLAGKETQNFIGTVDNLDKALKDNLGAIGTWYESGEKNVEDMIKRWERLKKAVEAGTDEVQQGGSGWGWWYTASDAVDDFRDANKAMLQDLSNQINAIDFSKPKDAIKQFDDLFKGQLGEMRDYAVRNIDKLFPDEPWAQMLKARMEQMRGFYDDYTKMMNDTADTAANLLKRAEKIIRDNNTAALDEGKREEQQSKNQRADELEEARKAGYDAETLRKVEDSINRKYDRQDIERREKHSKTVRETTIKNAEDLERTLKQIRDNRLVLMKEGLDKELKQLENSMQDELSAAEKVTKKRNELIKSIEEKYAFLMQQKREEWFKKHKDALDAFNKDLINMQREASAQLAEAMQMEDMNLTTRGIDQNENGHMQRRRNISYDIDIDSSANIESNRKAFEEQKKFHSQMLQEEKRYMEERQRLQLEESDKNMDALLKEEEARYLQQIEANDEAQRQKWEQVAQQAQQGIITEEEALELQQQITEKYQLADLDLADAHEKRVQEIMMNSEQEKQNILEQSTQDRQAAQNEANQQQIQSIQDMYDQIDYLSEQQERKNVSRTTGLFNISKERQRLKDVLKAYEDTLTEIDKEYEELKRQLNDGEIDFDQFQEGKRQLDSLKKDAKDAARETQESLDDLFQTWASSINSYVQKIAQEFQNLYGQFNEIMNLKYDIEEQQIEMEQERLDRETEMVDRAYEKQAEIVERYKNAINDTEDELQSARGERRLALIDSMAAQREEYLKETEALQQQQLEKEKIQRKEEALQKRQDALEKKRKQTQKQQSLVNAIINTALGVTQALSAYPPPASYALAAAVGALGAVQIGLISSQKYANGGQLDAPSHSQGGYKIPTKRGISEVEGNEFVVNKKTTMQNLDMMYFVNGIKRKITMDDMEKFFNSKGKISISPNHSLKFSQGGQMPELTDFNLKSQLQPQQQQPEIKVVAEIKDIANALDNYTTIQTLAGLADSSYRR